MKKLAFTLLTLCLGLLSSCNFTSTQEDKPEDGNSAVVNTYTVSFDMMNHGSQIEDILNVKEGSKISKPTDPIASGYTFEGWYKETSFENKWNFSTDVVTCDLTLFAKWSLRPTETFTVSFNNQGHGVAPDNQIVEKGSKVSKPADPTEEGYTFLGWYKEAACTNEWKFNVDTIVKNTTLFAKWEESLVKYFVVFSNTKIPYDIDYGVELKMIKANNYQVKIDSDTLLTSVCVRIVDTENTTHSCYDLTTNAFTKYYVKTVNNGIQIVAGGTYTFTLNTADTTSGISVVCDSILKYAIYESKLNSTDYDYFDKESSDSSAIIFTYKNLKFATKNNATYSIRQYIVDKFLSCEIRLSSRTSTKKFILNGTSFSYDDSSSVFGNERFNLTLTLSVIDLSLELDIVLC